MNDQFTFGSLFAGIGGIDLGFERAGMRCLWQCERDEFCRVVLARHFPSTPCFTDVRLLKDPPAVDVMVGGYPCQPFSLAGRRLAEDDPRHLWPEYRRLIGELRPRYAVGENVRGHVSKGLEQVIDDLSSLGYDAEWQVVSAAAFGAPHLRERVFWVAYPHSKGRPDAEGRPRSSGADGRRVFVAGPPELGLDEWLPEPDVVRVVHGVPGGVERVRALGNSVVPAVAEWLGHMIVAHA